MFPTCSKRDLAGRNALSAADLTIESPGRCTPPARAKRIEAARRPQPPSDVGERHLGARLSRAPDEGGRRGPNRGEAQAAGGMLRRALGQRATFSRLLRKTPR